MIKILDAVTANGIAAGEVIERPASVVKELVENSLDAGASIIHCDIEQGGIKKIIISDNGCGMTPEDAKLAFSRHATSKLTKISDLDHMLTMGFRGEALASIASVAKVCLRTRQIGADQGYEVRIEGGKVVSTGHVGCPEGTRIEIKDLFYNVPARYKFLKRDQTEQGYISDLITRLSLARADVSFRLSSNNKDLIHTPGNNNLLSVIYVLFGRDTAEAMVDVDYQLDPIKVSGFITTPQVARGNRSRQVVFVNGRNVISKPIISAINEASKTWFMKGKFPSLVINLEIPLNLVDVNVHPQKTEVRFWDDQIVFRSVYHSIKQALESGATVIKGEIESKKYQAVEPIVIIKQPPQEFLQKNQQVTQQEDFLFSGQSNSKNKSANIQTEFTFSKISEPTVEYQSKIADNNERLHPNQQAEAFMAYHQQAQTDLGQSIETDQPFQTSSQVNPESNHNVDSELKYLLEARLIGQIFKTYIMLEYRDEFIVIDQHAAHERILYEKLHNNYIQEKNIPFEKQLLLKPESLELTAQEISLVEENIQEFSHLGFEIDIFGETTILIRTVPDAIRAIKDPVSAVRVIVDSMVDESFFREDKFDTLLYGVACKAAIKANDNLSYNEMKQLINDLIGLNNPFHCPHGRPLIITLTKTDFEKLFKRIV